MTSLQNPWTRLPAEPPYILAEDLPWVSRFNDRAVPEHRLALDSLPEPYLGDVQNAPIVLLNLNPGHGDTDARWFNEHAGLREAVRANLEHRPSDCPLYSLNPAFEGFGGCRWWQAALAPLIAACGRQKVARRVAVVEWYPYHSGSFHPESPRSVAEFYSWQFARAAVADPERLVVVMRGRGYWRGVLGSLDGCIECSSARKATISPGNLPGAFERICAAVRGPLGR